MAWALIRSQQYLRTPWKNGRGFTSQIVIEPPTATVADRFSYRLSTATIDEDGPFSLFAGTDRVLVVLDGPGISIGGQRVRALEPFPFSGDDAVAATLAGGPVSDFNVMVDRAMWAVACDVIRFGNDIGRRDDEALADAWAADTSPDGDPPAFEVDATSALQFLFCVSGTLTCDGVQVAPRDTVAIDMGTPVSLSSRDAAVLHVRLTPR